MATITTPTICQTDNSKRILFKKKVLAILKPIAETLFVLVFLVVGIIVSTLILAGISPSMFVNFTN